MTAEKQAAQREAREIIAAARVTRNNIIDALIKHIYAVVEDDLQRKLPAITSRLLAGDLVEDLRADVQRSTTLHTHSAIAEQAIKSAAQYDVLTLSPELQNIIKGGE